MVNRGHRRARRPSRAGFTLMEVLLVLVILVVLGSMAVGVFGGARDKAFQDAARVQVNLFKSNIERYKLDTRQMPSGLEDLIKKPTESKVAERWAGPYIDGSSVPLDPWDNEYKFSAPGDHNPDGFDVWSTGPDGQDGTEDDIGNWD